MSGIIEPRTLKGFRDFPPEQEGPRRKILAQLEKVAMDFGYQAIDTPILEYAEVLLGKGGGETDKQVYRFQDHGGRDVAMRFDLTVPFARFMAAHMRSLPLPFKRYHFAKVFRGENTQRGRFREFIQCDFDSVGADSAAADLEILLLIHRTFLSMDIPEFRVRLSHRGLFNRFLASIGLPDQSLEILRAVDKLAKIGPEKTAETLKDICGEERSQKLLDFITAGRGDGGWKEVLAKLETLSGGPQEDSTRLREVLSAMDDLGLGDSFTLDPSITRGLDYYTGIVYETFLTRLPEIGSVCSGGRYNNLLGLYSKDELPGVGMSIGLDRLMAALEELGLLKAQASAPDIIIFLLEGKLLAHYHGIAGTLRDRGFSVEVYPLERKLGPQFSYAEKRQIPWAVIIGSKEAESGLLQLKNLRNRETHDGISQERMIQILENQ